MANGFASTTEPSDVRAQPDARPQHAAAIVKSRSCFSITSEIIGPRALPVSIISNLLGMNLGKFRQLAVYDGTKSSVFLHDSFPANIYDAVNEWTAALFRLALYSSSSPVVQECGEIRLCVSLST